MWFLSARKSRKTRAHSHRSAYRPQIEALEDRCVPSAAGSLDPTFGNGAGYVTTATTAYTDRAPCALIQADGDIVASGLSGAPSSSVEFSVTRYNPDGSLDTSFGTGGVALANFGPGVAESFQAALYPAGTANAGDIVQVGYYDNPLNTSEYLALARYNPNGTLDSSFGTGGQVMVAVPGMSGAGGLSNEMGVVLTSAGQIVAFNNDGGHFVLARFNANGTLDNTFGNGGYVITNVAGGDPADGGNLIQQPNGDLIVTAVSGPNGSYNNDQGGVWYMYRFNPNGTLDTSFGN